MAVYYISNESIDNFESTMQIIYQGVEDKILSEEEIKEQNKEELYKDTTIFESDSPFVGYPIRENDTIRAATKVELVQLGYQELEDGEYIENDELIKIERPSWQYKWVSESKKWIPDETKLHEGQYAEEDNIVDVPYNDNLGYVTPHWNAETHVWEDISTDEEKLAYYKELINTLKAKILEQGYNYNEHQQKCRDKDLALLGNAIAANEDASTYATDIETVWSFNDGDVVKMSLDELKLLRIQGAVFVQAIFTVEAQLKAGEVNIHFTGKEFIEKVNEISDVKCYFNDIKETEIPSLNRGIFK